MEAAQKTNPVLRDTIRACEEAGRTNDAAIWSRVAEELDRANRKQREVSVSHIDRNAEDGETVVVPGKVVGRGTVDPSVTVAAFAFTDNARDAIEANGEAVWIDELVEENPAGAGLRLLG